MGALLVKRLLHRLPPLLALLRRYDATPDLGHFLFDNSEQLLRVASTEALQRLEGVDGTRASSAALPPRRPVTLCSDKRRQRRRRRAIRRSRCDGGRSCAKVRRSRSVAALGLCRRRRACTCTSTHQPLARSRRSRYGTRTWGHLLPVSIIPVVYNMQHAHSPRDTPGPGGSNVPAREWGGGGGAYFEAWLR